MLKLSLKKKKIILVQTLGMKIVAIEKFLVSNCDTENQKG